MKNLTFLMLTVASIVVILCFMLTSCDTPIEAEDVLNPGTVTVDDLTTILEGMPLSDVKAALSGVDPEVRSLIGVHALNSLPDDELAFDSGKLIEGEVRDGAASAVLDELINECLTEIPTLTAGNLTNAQREEFVNSHCFTNMRLKFRDLNQIYSVLLEDILSKQYTLPPLN